jgi:endonuclease/exonuclease/phosphatase family metal-dependent hydrolase
MKTRKRTAAIFSKNFCFIAVLFFFLHKPYSSMAQCKNDSSNTEELKILSWNVYMLPHLCVHTGQFKRAHEIVEALKNEDLDIIVFEEAFDNKARAIIWNGLKPYFPFQSGDPEKNVSWKISGGVWIISRIPINVIKRIYFNHAQGSDRMACKGAVLIEAEKNNSCFQLIGTHLQSDLEHHDVRETRKTQYKQIEDELLDKYRKKDIPQFVVGDFNTIEEDSASFNQMLNVMKVTECPVKGDRHYSFDYSNNDFIIGQPYKPQLIDYVLFRADGERKVAGQTSVKVFRKKWDDKHKDLSDHFAISAVISMK